MGKFISIPHRLIISHANFILHLKVSPKMCQKVSLLEQLIGESMIYLFWLISSDIFPRYQEVFRKQKFPAHIILRNISEYFLTVHQLVSLLGIFVFRMLSVLK